MNKIFINYGDCFFFFLLKTTNLIIITNIIQI